MFTLGQQLCSVVNNFQSGDILHPQIVEAHSSTSFVWSATAAVVSQKAPEQFTLGQRLSSVANNFQSRDSSSILRLLKPISILLHPLRRANSSLVSVFLQRKLQLLWILVYVIIKSIFLYQNWQSNILPPKYRSGYWVDTIPNNV